VKNQNFSNSHLQIPSSKVDLTKSAKLHDFWKSFMGKKNPPNSADSKIKETKVFVLKNYKNYIDTNNTI